MMINHTRPHGVMVWATLIILTMTVSGCSVFQAQSAGMTEHDPLMGNPGGASSQPLAESLPDAQPTTTATPSPTLTLTPIPTQTQTPSHTPSPTPTPLPTLRQLTSGGCCTQPFWSPDSQRVLFIDKPSPQDPVGIWGVDVKQPNPTPELVTEQIAFYTADMSFRIEVNDDTTTIEQLENGGTSQARVVDRWTVATGGRSVSISPNGRRIVWQVSDDDLPSEERVTQVWVANIDGSQAGIVIELPRGGFGSWISDDELLLSQRETLQSRETELFVFSLVDGQRTELAKAEQLRNALLSPDGSWLVYMISLGPDPSQNGTWLVSTDGSNQFKLDDDLFGAYQWRDSQHLLIVPFRPDATSHRFWELDVTTGEVIHLTDPDVIPFKIANGDWATSPDGKHIVFVESRDRNLWLLTLNN